MNYTLVDLIHTNCFVVVVVVVGVVVVVVGVGFWFVCRFALSVTRCILKAALFAGGAEFLKHNSQPLCVSCKIV